MAAVVCCGVCADEGDVTSVDLVGSGLPTAGDAEGAPFASRAESTWFSLVAFEEDWTPSAGGDAAKRCRSAGV